MDDPEYILLEPFSEKKVSPPDTQRENVVDESKPEYSTHLGSHKHILVTVIVKQALINASKISPGIEYDAVSIKTVPCVTWEEEFKEKKLFHTNEVGEEMNTSFGIANYQTKFSCSDMLVEELLSFSSLSIKFKIHFMIPGEEGQRKAHATATVDIVNWIKEISPIIRKARKKDKLKPIHKFKNYEVVLNGEVSDGSKSDLFPDIGKLFCLVQVGTHRGALVLKTNELVDLLSVENGEKVSQHIHDYCLVPEFVMTDGAPYTLLDAIEGPLLNERGGEEFKTPKIEPSTVDLKKNLEESPEVSLEEEAHIIEEPDEHVKKKAGISPNSFFILTDLLCIKDRNPILYACVATGLARKYEEFYHTVSDTQKRQWGDIKSKCEKRAQMFLDLASQIYPGEYGKIGNIWKSQLLKDVPDAVLAVDSPSIASHGLIVDVLRERWQASHTNKCCGVTCCLPRRNPSLIGQLKLFNTPKATFFLEPFSLLSLS